MQSTAQQYLVYDLTNSTLMLGLVTFASGLPSIVLAPFTGVIADRIPRRTLMVITQSVMLVLAFILAILKFTNVVQYWHIIILAFLLGIANAFDAPARQSFAIELVDDRKDMANAIALNSAMFNMATIVGPAASGMIYFLVGPAWCFTINGISFIAVIVALLMMKLRPFVPHQSEGNVFKEMSTGFKYVFSHNIVMWLIITLGIISLIGFGVSSQSPAWAKGVLGGDERTNGWMMTFRGAGSLVGALLVAAVVRRKLRGRLLTIGSFLLPVSLGLLAMLPFLHITSAWMVAGTMFLVALMGAALMLIANTANAFIQSDVPDHLRGRVMGIYTLIFMGGMPLGSLLIGNVAPFLTLPITVGLLAAILLLYSLGMLIFNPRIRQMDKHLQPDAETTVDKSGGS
jgi:MFS family permease